MQHCYSQSLLGKQPFGHSSNETVFISVINTQVQAVISLAIAE